MTKTAELLHLSLALQACRDANVWATAARQDGCQMIDDQLEECREYAADYRRIARDHLADARLAKAARLTSRYYGRIGARPAVRAGVSGPPREVKSLGGPDPQHLEMSPMPKANTHSTTRAARHQRPVATIASQIEELLRIRGEAEETAAFLIGILDDRDADPDLEEEPDREDGGDDEAEEEDQNLGATHGLNQERTWQNASGWLGGDGEPSFASTPREDATGFYFAAVASASKNTKVGRDLCSDRRTLGGTRRLGCGLRPGGPARRDPAGRQATVGDRGMGRDNRPVRRSGMARVPAHKGGRL